MTHAEMKAKLAVIEAKRCELLSQLAVIGNDRETLLEGLYPVVYVNSTDHDRALPSGNYFLVSAKSAEDLKFQASSHGVKIITSSGTVELENWDPEAELIPTIYG